MAITTKSSTNGFASRVAESTKLVAAAMRAYATALVNRRAARHLSEMPDYILSDLGLKRDDVHDALSQDWRTDPTYILAYQAARRSHERFRR